MKNLIMALMGTLFVGLGIAVAADKDAKLTTYTVGMSGVTWGGCKSYVRAAFKKLDGVVAKDVEKDIQIAAGEPGKQKITFKSSNAQLTKDQLIAAIGAKKDRYKVETVATDGD